MMTCEGPLSPRWLPMPASTDMATASAAARELTPFGPDDPEGLRATELCWITGAGEPVASHISFMDSSPRRHNMHGSVTQHSQALNKSLNPLLLKIYGRWKAENFYIRVVIYLYIIVSFLYKSIFNLYINL